MFFFLTLPSLLYAGIFGIDYGSEYIKVAVASPSNGVQVALNQQSKRLSPSYFALWETNNPKSSNTYNTYEENKNHHWSIDQLQNMSWSYLDSAKTHSRRFPNNTYQGIHPILGNRNGLTGREVFALVLRHLLSTISDGHYKPEESSIVISVEPNLRREERIAISDAVKLANVSLISIVDSPTAVATVYAREKKALFAYQPKTVLFYDMGSANSWAGIFRFTLPGKGMAPIVEQLAVVHDSSLGGKYMDQKLANHLMSKFSEKNKVNLFDQTIPNQEKIYQQFLEEAKRAKEMLTTDKYVTIKMDDIVNEHGLNYVLPREEFNDLISDISFSIQNLFLETVRKANLDVLAIESIELIGGPTRVPFVYKELMKASGMAKLNRTMNSDEAVALGAGYIAAARSFESMKETIKFRPFCGINISLHKNSGTSEFIHTIFNENSLIDSIAKVDLKVDELGELEVVSSSDGGINQTLYTFNFENVANMSSYLPSDEISLMFYFDSITFPALYSAYVNKNIRLNPEVLYPTWKMSKNELENSTSFINRIDKITSERQHYQKVKNDFESLLYRIQDQAEYNETLKYGVSESKLESLTETLEKYKNWLYNNNDQTVKEFEIRTDELNKEIQSINFFLENNRKERKGKREGYDKNIQNNDIKLNFEKELKEEKKDIKIGEDLFDEDDKYKKRPKIIENEVNKKAENGKGILSRLLNKFV